MSKDLYFIRLLSEAVSQPNARPAIRRAMERITNLGKDRGYKQGYLQFRLFIHKVFEASESEVTWLAGNWGKHSEETVLKFNVVRDENLIASLPLVKSNIPQRIPDAVAGNYTFKLNTGRILWQGELTDQDLVWTTAFPEADLAMAADTGDHADHVTREISLLEGDLVIRVIPELEGGRIDLEIRN